MLHFRLKPATGDEKPSQKRRDAFRPEAESRKLGLERFGVDSEAVIARAERRDSARIEAEKEKSMQFSLH